MTYDYFVLRRLCDPAKLVRCTLKVIHLKRTFLARTETFVYTQLTHLQRAESMVLTRDLLNLDLFPYANVRAFCSEPQSWCKRWADLSYRTVRHMSAHEQRFYCRQVSDWVPDLLHAHYAVDAAYFSELRRMFDKPLVVSCYGYDVSSFPRQYLGYGRRYLQRVFDTADLFLAMSQDMKNDLMALGVEESRILIHHPNGVDLTQFGFSERQLEPERKVRVLCVATLEENKGVEYLVAAFAEVWKHTRHVELRLVGDGSLRSKLTAQVKGLGLEEAVTMPGFVNHDQLAKEYQAAHLFCLPSVTSSTGLREGIPTVLVEAQATGLPTVSTWHAGVPEVVIDGQTGFLVKERDTDELAERLIHLVDHPESWAALGRAGRAHVEQYFEVNMLARELEMIYGRFPLS